MDEDENVRTHRDADAVRPIAVGTMAWAVALVVLLTQRSWLDAHDATWWLAVCALGTVLGLAGLWFARRRRAAYARAGRAAD